MLFLNLVAVMIILLSARVAPYGQSPNDETGNAEHKQDYRISISEMSEQHTEYNRHSFHG